MSKLEMSPANKRRESVINPEIVDGAPQTTVIEKKSASPVKAGKSSEILSQKNITSVFEIAKIIVQGQAEIAKIRAISEAEIQKVESEIKKIIVSTQSEITKMREENSNWHSKFDARQQAVQKTLEFLDAHPEYSDEVKKSIIQLAIAEIEKQ